MSGELARRLRLVELIDAQLAGWWWHWPSASSSAATFFDDIEDLRADRPGDAGLRAVAETPSAPTALQVARRFRRSHVQRIERAQARVGAHLDRAVGRDPSEPPTVDLDATQVTVLRRPEAGRGAQRPRGYVLRAGYGVLGRARPPRFRRARRPRGWTVLQALAWPFAR